VAESSYLRYPHLARDLITFTAEDDVWLASLSEAADGRGTRAWRLTADQAPVLHPRLNPPATHIAWTSTRDGSRSLGRGAAREAYAVPAEGGPVSRLTYWGDRFATVRGWVSDNEVLALSRAGQHSTMKTWAFAVPLSGPARRLGYGPAGDVAVRDGAVLVGSAMNFEPAEPAQWKGYRGGAGRYDKLRAARDGVVWLELPFAGELGETVIGAAGEQPTRLIRYDLAERRRSVEAEALDDYAVSGDGARVAYRTSESLEIKPTGLDEVDSVDLDRIRVTVEPPTEWTQMYHETWRLMRDNFWRADMAGVDWAAMADRYRPLLDRIGSTDDLRDVLWELQGEMGSSHAGVLPPAAGGDPALAQGLLGADVERAGDGTWRIARILPGESSVIGARSPLAAPGVAAAPGDLIVAVDGRPVDPDLGPNALLAGKADKPVELTLRRDGADRRAVVVPLASEHAAGYYDLVARQRAAVCETSGGRLGYLNIPDMMARGWAEFHRDLYTEFRRDGLIVDLRDTQGGDAGQLVAEKLARRIIGWNVSRYEEPSSYPADAPRGPIVAITDEYASSGGDIVIQVLKSYGIATVVGTRTWGGVRGVDFKYELVDGTLVAQPKYAYWFAGVGWTLENHGVEPDVEVTIAPHDWAAGRDPQLDTAVRLALQALEQRTAAAPPTP
jgi:tricorn protease